MLNLFLESFCPDFLILDSILWFNTYYNAKETLQERGQFFFFFY